MTNPLFSDILDKNKPFRIQKDPKMSHSVSRIGLL